MEQDILVVKTLPHLIPWHLNQMNVSLYATAYNLQIDRYLRNLKKLELNKYTYSEILSIIESTGIVRADTVSPSTFTVKGDTISLWPIGYSEPIRIEYFDQGFESASQYDVYSGRTISNIDWLLISAHQLADASDATNIHLSSSSNGLIAVFTPYIPEHRHGNLSIISNDFDYPQLFWGRFDLLEQEVSRYLDQDYTIRIISQHFDSLPQELRRFVVSDFEGVNLAAGFVSTHDKVLALTDREIFGTVYLKATDNTTGSKLLRQLEGEIKPGDYIVHQEHGIGIYRGITQEKVGTEMLEYLQIDYAGEDQLFVPINQVQKLTKYIGMGDTPPKLTKLNGTSWDTSTKKVNYAVKILAKELIEHYARRELSDAPVISLEDSEDYLSFVANFPYTETKDQITSINEILKDLSSSTPMNRVLVGDVGFGKTEVMMRAAFKMVEAGFQVAILTPTTVLAAQHFAVFKDRFKHTDIKVASVSRFATDKQNNKSVDNVNQGDIDILIGTHRLLSNDVKFKNLGLLIVDEEQRFGVRQKEKLRKLNYGVHYLSVSATPIPRTLSMALSTIQDISVMTTPPQNRVAITTELIKGDWQKVVTAIHQEVGRGGQVYFVHNRVQSIPSINARLTKLLPNVRFGIAHGQMSPSELDNAMNQLYRHNIDVMICSTIIENGIDLPNVNTIIINDAHKFGLAQLYQLRGRVGRSDRQAYCYLFYQGSSTKEHDPQFKESEKQLQKYLPRLQSIIDAKELGSGFRVASRDLEIRGAGSLLGEKQSGHISQIGYALYMKLLADEIEKLRAGTKLETPEFLTL